jgi:protein SCO1/2
MRASRSQTELVLVVLCASVAWAGEPQPLKHATRSSVAVTVPEISLQRDDGKTVTLSSELTGTPVALTFIFTKCGTICPVMSQTFAKLQRSVGQQVRLVSISIDPEYDTSSRLAEYSRKVGAGGQWHFYTGTTEASVSTQRAFETFRGDKMDHTPVTFLRGSTGPWERIDGFASAEELAVELKRLGS